MKTNEITNIVGNVISFLGIAFIFYLFGGGVKGFMTGLVVGGSYIGFGLLMKYIRNK